MSALTTKDRRCPVCSKLAGRAVLSERHADGKCALCSRRRAAAANEVKKALAIRGRGRGMDMPGYVYALQIPASDTIKIGATGDLETRLRGLRSKHGRDSFFLASWKVENCGVAEVAAHVGCAEFLVGNEIFRAAATQIIGCIDKKLEGM